MAAVFKEQMETFGLSTMMQDFYNICGLIEANRYIDLTGIVDMHESD